MGWLFLLLASCSFLASLELLSGELWLPRPWWLTQSSTEPICVFCSKNVTFRVSYARGAVAPNLSRRVELLSRRVQLRWRLANQIRDRKAVADLVLGWMILGAAFFSTLVALGAFWDWLRDRLGKKT